MSSFSQSNRSANKRILYLQYNNPAAYPPVLNSASILRSHGFQVFFLGTDSAHLTGLEMPADAADGVRLLRQPKKGLGLKLFFFLYTIRALITAIRLRPDYLYVSDHTACPAAWLILRLLKTKVIYHEHDSPAYSNRLKTRFLTTARDRIAKNAVVCILPNQDRARHFIKMVGQPLEVEVVWNCPRMKDLPELDERRVRSHDEALLVYYIGSLNEQRVPSMLVSALARVPLAELRLIGYETNGAPNFLKQLFETATSAGVRDRVSFLGTQSREKIFESLLCADVALSLMPMGTTDINMTCMVGASNKAFDALACGVPILVSDLPAWCSTFVDAGVARACSPKTAESLAAALKWFCEHPEASYAMGMEGRAQIEGDWNYQSQFEKVLRRISADSLTEVVDT